MIKAANCMLSTVVGFEIAVAEKPVHARIWQAAGAITELAVEVADDRLIELARRAEVGESPDERKS